MKYLNDKAVADAIVANRKVDTNAISPAFQKAAEEALAARAKAAAK
jgi:hypothetical protein